MSASKVREQLEVARTLGLVEVRSKTGTRLQTYSFTPAVRLSLLYVLARTPRLFEQFSELRIHIETAFWNEACESMLPEDQEVMLACVQDARRKLTSDWVRIPHTEHRTFHLTMFNRLENPFVVGLLEAYWDAYNAVNLSTYTDYQYLQTVWDYHDRTINAICEKDFDTAKAIFVEHTTFIDFIPGMQAIHKDESTHQDQ